MFKNCRWALGLAALLLIASQAQALRTNYAEVLVENLQIDAQYNMTQLANLPLEIINNSGQTMALKIEPVLPEKPREGFAPIPSVKWVKIAQPSVVLKAGEKFKTDVLISIPNQKKYLGKKYEVQIWSHETGSAENKDLLQVVFGVKGRLLFTIAPIKQKQGAMTSTPNLNFKVRPETVMLMGVPLGKPQPVLVGLKGDSGVAESKPIEVINEGDQKIELAVQSIDPKAAGINLEGFEACPDPAFLTVNKKQFVLDGKATETLDLQLQIPDQPEYRGKKYLFLVSVSTVGTQVSGQRLVRVMADQADPKTVEATTATPTEKK